MARGWSVGAEVVRYVGPSHSPARFALLRELGRGGMGVVYEAQDRACGARVALKLVSPENPRFVARLLRGHRLMRRFSHRNLMRVFTMLECEESWALTMELVEGQPWRSWVHGAEARASNEAVNEAVNEATDDTASEVTHDLSLERERGGGGDVGEAGGGEGGRASFAGRPAGATTLAWLAQLVPQLGAGLSVLHASGLVHGDVTPRNVLITSERRLILIDFDLTRCVRDEPCGQRYAGTPAYMAPEQLAGGRVTGAADCYAVGVMLYRALTGRLPFVGARRDLLHHKRTTTPVAPSWFAPELPRALERLCLRLLAPDPEARPAAEELAAGWWR